MTYDVTFNSVWREPWTILTRLNDISNGLFAGLLIFTLYVGWGYEILKQTGSFSKALMLPGFTLGGIGILMTIIDWLGPEIPVICLVLGLAGLFLSGFEG